MLWVFACILVALIWFLRSDREGVARGRAVRKWNGVARQLDFPGNDIGKKPIKGTYPQCLAACAADKNCVQVVSRGNSGDVTCYLKSKIGKTKPNKDLSSINLVSGMIYEGSTVQCKSNSVGGNGAYRYMGNDVLSAYPSDEIGISWDPNYKSKSIPIDCLGLKKGPDLEMHELPAGWTAEKNVAVDGTASLLQPYPALYSATPDECIGVCAANSACKIAVLDPSGKCAMRTELKRDGVKPAKGSTIYRGETECPTGPEPLNKEHDTGGGYIY
jgi:hypothetical protein